MMKLVKRLAFILTFSPAEKEWHRPPLENSGVLSNDHRPDSTDFK